VLHLLEHETIPLQCYHILWNGVDTVIVGRYIGAFREIGWGTQLKITAHELTALSDEVQTDLERLDIDQRAGVFLHTTHRFAE
jgi:hypothetical protein